MFYPHRGSSGGQAVSDYPAAVYGGGGTGWVAISSNTERSCGPLRARCFKSGSLSLEGETNQTNQTNITNKTVKIILIILKTLRTLYL
jgi:hypothetical protein